MEGHRWFFICVLAVGVVSAFSQEEQLKPISGGNNEDLRLPSIPSSDGRTKRHASDDKTREKLGNKVVSYMSKGMTKEKAFDKVVSKYPKETKNIYNPKAPGSSNPNSDARKEARR